MQDFLFSEGYLKKLNIFHIFPRNFISIPHVYLSGVAAGFILFYFYLFFVEGGFEVVGKN